MPHMYYLYILGSDHGTLYIGVTNNLAKRVYQHKQKIIVGFTQKYTINKLFYFEEFTSIEEAIKREKQSKHWNRAWKLELIETKNPEYKDLYESIL